MMRTVLAVLILTVIGLAGCAEEAKQAEVVELKHYPLDILTGIIDAGSVELDAEVTADGNGAVKVVAADTTVIRLFETGDIDVENARLFYQAKMRAEDVAGRAYLEMYCHFPGMGAYFSRDLESPVTGTQDWTSEETFFLLEEGQNPDNVKLNLVVEGGGTVWIDDIHLVKGPVR